MNKEELKNIFCFLYKTDTDDKILEESIIYVKTSDNDKIEYKLNDNEKIFLMPSLDADHPDRICICGSSGSGKSVLTNLYTKFYKMINPEDKIYYITTNNFYEDKNLNHEYYNFINAIEFIKMIENYEKQYNKEGKRYDIVNDDNFYNVLLIFDDIDTIDDVNEKKLWRIIIIMLHNMRKYNTSIIVTLHSSAVPLKKTRQVIGDMTHYIIFPKRQNASSDLALNRYLGLNMQHKKDILNSTDHWICDSIRLKMLFGPSFIKKIIF